ncbi:hypothetical protein [Moraxella lacunata]|uniref:hypothetical protein n=1 Tax=Moraxella lacunata TaxID=477 RepID=UPI003EE04E27
MATGEHRHTHDNHKYDCCFYSLPHLRFSSFNNLKSNITLIRCVLHTAIGIVL